MTQLQTLTLGEHQVHKEQRATAANENFVFTEDFLQVLSLSLPNWRDDATPETSDA